MSPLDCFGLTDPGRERAENEDQFLIADLHKTLFVRRTSLASADFTRLTGSTQGHLLLVADGMGGAAAGAQAGRIAVAAVVRYVLNTMPWFFRLDDRRADDLREELAAALRESQEALQSVVEEHPERRGMGTTLTLAYLLASRAYVVHVGDSRCYRYRNGRLDQVTTDHTVAHRLVHKGVLKKEEEALSPWSHVLWNVVGGGTAELNPEVRRFDLRKGDVLLLCTDGLSKQVSDDAIAEVLGLGAGAEETCHRLIGAANAAGGRDNATVVVASLREAKPAAAAGAASAAAEVPDEEPLEAAPTEAGVPLERPDRA
jgi:protein phosphatase